MLPRFELRNALECILPQGSRFRRNPDFLGPLWARCPSVEGGDQFPYARDRAIYEAAGVRLQDVTISR